MEPSKAQGKRSFKYKMEEEAEEAEEEEEEEEDDDVSGPLGFSSGGDEYMMRRKRPSTSTATSANTGSSRVRGSGSGAGGPTVRPLCQADSCNADLSEAKHYHRRHKICEFHAKAAVVLVGGLQQRFCQQCSRYYIFRQNPNFVELSLLLITKVLCFIYLYFIYLYIYLWDWMVWTLDQLLF